MKRTKYKEDEYRFASAKIACLIANMPSHATVSGLCELTSVAALCDRLPELGLSCAKELEDRSLETLLTAALSLKYTYLTSFLPDSEICEIMQSRFDCHNVKTAIKCSKAGLDPKPYFIECGRFDADAVTKAVAGIDFSAFPAVIAQAAEKAFAAINENAEARYVDTFLDNACFSYMKEQADALGCKPISNLLSMKADVTNVTTLLRILKIRNAETRKSVACDAFVSGGSFNPAFDEEKTDKATAVSYLKNVISDNRYKKLVSLVDKDASNDEISAYLDSVFYSETKDVSKTGLLGIYPVLDYVLETEYLVKNVRIIAAGIAAGKKPEQIREEIRGYV